MNKFISRRRSIGLTAGALWLISISFVFIIWSLLAIGTMMAKYVLIGAFVFLIVLIVMGIIVLRAT